MLGIPQLFRALVRQCGCNSLTLYAYGMLKNSARKSTQLRTAAMSLAAQCTDTESGIVVSQGFLLCTPRSAEAHDAPHEEEKIYNQGIDCM